jgi:hypothetical protein
MFPNAQHLPAQNSERSRYKPVARLVSKQLFLPKIPITGRHGCVLGATVPEATVHENRSSFLRKHEVRLSGQGPSASPTLNSLHAKERNQPEFGGFIPCGTHARHYFGACSLRKYVRHSLESTWGRFGSDLPFVNLRKRAAEAIRESTNHLWRKGVADH